MVCKGAGMTEQYRVGVTADVPSPNESIWFWDIGLDRLTAAGLKWEILVPAYDGRLVGLNRFDAVLSLGHQPFSQEAVAAAPRLKHVARLGAGYDGIDVDGLTAEGVVVTTTPDAARRPLALAAMTLLLAVSHRLVENHRTATSGRWSDRGQHRGVGLAGRTVGILGFGSVGADLAKLLAPIGVRLITNDRPSTRRRAAEHGMELVDLERLAAESDYLVVTAALTDSSRGLISAKFLASMKRTAYLINVARGGLVDQDALTTALREKSIAGAGLDVLEPEPPKPDEPLLAMDNVLVTPHALCWTADFTESVSTSAIEAIIDVAQGRRPTQVLNDAVYAAPVQRRPRHQQSATGTRR